MSTYYKKPQSPITDLQIHRLGAHLELSIFISHKLAGRLTFGIDEEPNLIDFLHMCAGPDVAQYTSAGGGQFKIFQPSVDGTVISEYGELHSMDKLRRGNYEPKGY